MKLLLTGMWKHLLMKTDNKTNTSKISWTLSIFDSSSSTDIKKNSIFIYFLLHYLNNVDAFIQISSHAAGSSRDATFMNIFNFMSN